MSHKSLLEKIKRPLFRSRTLEKRFSQENARLYNQIIMNYLLTENTGEFDPKEKSQIVTYLSRHPLSVFPYNFSEKYVAKNIPVYKEKLSKHSHFFVLHENKRLYFPEGWCFLKDGMQKKSGSAIIIY
jgi:hypothetical protein